MNTDSLHAPSQLYHPKLPNPVFLRLQADLVPYLITFLEHQYPVFLGEPLEDDDVSLTPESMPLIGVFMSEKGEGSARYNRHMLREFLSSFYSKHDSDFDLIAELALELIIKATRKDVHRVLSRAVKEQQSKPPASLVEQVKEQIPPWKNVITE